jgi:hypothetical protein
MQRKIVKSVLWTIAIPVIYALILRLVFNLDIIKDFVQIMSITFFISVPFGIGVITVVLARPGQVNSLRFCITRPWIPVMIFFLITILLSLEGWACWIMILPVFLFFASIGGLVARYFRLKKNQHKLNISLVFLLPVVLSAFENNLSFHPATYEAYNFIDIHASKNNIWEHVVRVKEITWEEDNSSVTAFLGFPRPIKAELDTLGIGGRRKAIFSKGLVFDEVVTTYTHQHLMQFTITANPYDIPSTTMDKHVVIGGEYFNVLNGTYELEKINDVTWRLHLYSHFELKTNFNFYASWWACWIMRDIQQNILQVIKKRCESLTLGTKTS